MTSYHDLEEQTYRSVVAEDVTRIYGKPTWQAKERLKMQLGKIAIKHKVSYDWSGGKGLIPLIIGATRWAADYPALAAFVQPTQPPNAPTIAAGTTQHIAKELRDQNDLMKRDWAVVCGFNRGVGEVIRRSIDSKFYEDLEHVSYGYDDVLPRDYIHHLEDEHCPLDEQAIKKVRDHYFRGWERNKTPRPEGLKKFGKRLDEEQAALDRDGITVSDADKKDHYLIQVYTSGVWPAAIIREWKKKPYADQTYANAKDFFEDEAKGLGEVERLMGDAAPANGFESAAAVLERGLDAMLEKFNANVEERIAAAVDTGLQRIAAEKATPDAANAVTEQTVAALQSKIDTLNSKMGKLQKDLAAVQQQKHNNPTDDSGKPADAARANPTSLQSKYGEWTMGLTLDPKWPRGKQQWYRTMLKKHEPERAKAEYKAFLQKQLQNLE